MNIDPSINVRVPSFQEYINSLEIDFKIEAKDFDIPDFKALFQSITIDLKQRTVSHLNTIGNQIVATQAKIDQIGLFFCGRLYPLPQENVAFSEYGPLGGASTAFQAAFNKENEISEKV